ncbi:MAG: PstS family phosphate ABC transporter substrate-binding protein [Deltaproteobacteria bacterium]|nr:PstS family phosphate ABC transporter substrate-binding protein [Deltaproteobacteria bacterium]
MGKFFAVVCVALLAGGVIACKKTPKVATPGGNLIRIDGSSTVFPITEAVAEEFQKAKAGTVKVTVGISGTGGGFKKFCRGETDVQDASRPIQASEQEACKIAGIDYIELPVAYDALTVVIHPTNTWAATLTVEDLKKIWASEAQGRLTTWKQIRPEWPDQPLRLYGPGADSGTFDYFTEIVVGKAKASRGDYTASEDDNVLVQGVANDPHALGYFGFAYYVENQGRLKAAAIDGGKGPVLPSAQTVERGTYRPLSRPIFIYLNKAALARSEVAEFAAFYLQQGPLLVAEVKYVPLPSMVYDLAGERLKNRVAGTVFRDAGDIGVNIADLLKRPATK